MLSVCHWAASKKRVPEVGFRLDELAKPIGPLTNAEIDALAK